MIMHAGPDPALPEYDQTWLKRYDRLEPADAEITQAEMDAFGLLARAATATLDRHKVSYLDLGTCTGRYLRWGCEQSFGIICGVDRSSASISHCAHLCRPGRVYLYNADFLSGTAMRDIAVRHGPFHLVTAMLGTVDHVSRQRQARFFRLISDVLSPVGTLVVSSWRAGHCDLSLYSEREQSYLESTGFADLIEGNLGRLQLVRTVSTPWHLLAAFTQQRAP
jgi:hypothetical protein